jgi:hypothetical protein
MKINLKKLAQQKEALKDVASTNQSNMYRKLLRELTSWIEEVETDLEMGGESVVELDQERLTAIEERDKFLSFYKLADDI